MTDHGEHGNHERHGTADGHPEALLAGFVDGSAGPDEAATVEAHLATCPSCADEVRLARAAREALRTLPEAPSPWAERPEGPVTAAQLAEARRGSVVPLARRRDRQRTTSRAAAALVAAAAVVAGLVVVLPNLGGGPASTTAPAGARAPEATASDQSASSLDELARSIAHAPEATPATGGPASQDGTPGSRSSLSLTPTALSCAIDATGVGSADTIVSFQSTTYQGTPAYVVGYRTPSSAERPGHVVVAAIDRSSCTILYLVRANAEP
jgi:anti-sigma factor RsiW